MASSDGNNKKRVTLRSLDGEEFVVDAEIAMQSDTIKNFLDDDEAEAGAGDAIPLPNVTGTILAKVIEYCKKHRQEPSKDESDPADEALKSWDAEFLKVSQHTLFDLIMAADYLSIKSLLDFTCQNVADQMRGKTPEAIREHFHIENDYTKEEEDAVRRENAWAFD